MSHNPYLPKIEDVELEAEKHHASEFGCVYCKRRSGHDPRCKVLARELEKKVGKKNV